MGDTPVKMDQRIPDAVMAALAMVPTGAIAGLAALMRTKNKREKITTREAVSAMMNSGILAGAICLLMYHYSPDSHYLNVGLSALSGLGGNTAVGFTLLLRDALVESYLKIPRNKGDE